MFPIFCSNERVWRNQATMLVDGGKASAGVWTIGTGFLCGLQTKAGQENLRRKTCLNTNCIFHIQSPSPHQNQSTLIKQEMIFWLSQSQRNLYMLPVLLICICMRNYGGKYLSCVKQPILWHDQSVTHNHYAAQRGTQARNIKPKLNCSQAIAHANDVKAHTHTHTHSLFHWNLVSRHVSYDTHYIYIPHSLQLFKCLLLITLIQHNLHDKLQALVYDILPSTTAVFSYAIGSRKLSANEQFFVGAQTVASSLQTTQIKQGVSFIAVSKVYTSANKTTNVWIETELFFLFFYPGWMHLMFTWVLWCYVASTDILVPEHFGGRWPHQVA